jgi:hypothetical protein
MQEEFINYLSEKEKSYALKLQNGKISTRVIPSDDLTADLCCVAVQYDSTALSHIPEHFKNANLYLRAVRHFPAVIIYVPAKYISVEMATLAVANQGYLLQCVPDSVKTREMCLLAVQNFPGAIRYVPERIHSRKVDTNASCC